MSVQSSGICVDTIAAIADVFSGFSQKITDGQVGRFIITFPDAPGCVITVTFGGRVSDAVTRVTTCACGQIPQTTKPEYFESYVRRSFDGKIGSDLTYCAISMQYVQAPSLSSNHLRKDDYDDLLSVIESVIKKRQIFPAQVGAI